MSKTAWTDNAPRDAAEKAYDSAVVPYDSSIYTYDGVLSSTDSPPKTAWTAVEP